MPEGWPRPEELEWLASEATVVPVWREVVSDTLTPVTALAAVGGGPGSFLLESVSGGEKWARYSFVGFEPERIVRGVADRFEQETAEGVRVERGVDPWRRLQEVLGRYRPPREVPWLPRFWGGAVGYVSYDAVRTFEPTVGPALPADGDELELSFAIGGTILVFDHARQTLRIVAPAHLDGGDPARAHAEAVGRIDRAIARLAAAGPVRPLPLPDPSYRGELPPSSFEPEAFRQAVVRVQEHIRAGDAFQVVLSQRFRIPAAGIDAFDVYRAMRVVNPSPYMYFVRLPEATIAGASPETLVRLEGGVVEVRPIAGTRRRGATEAEDLRAESDLLADPKERAEHVMLVDLGRNDVGRIAETGTVEITERMAVERYSHVMHMVSNVAGRLAPGRGALEVLRATFPAGTLSGAPKVRAMQIIEGLEPERRGIYGGAVGYIGFGGNMDMAIAIRTVVERDGELRLQAGAGIVEASDPEREWEETVNKARAGLVAIDAAARARG